MFLKEMLARTTLLMGLLATTAPAFAHHAFAAEFDANKPIELKGVLTKIEWMNPHSWIYIDVKDATGKVTSWGIEFGGPNALLRRGIRKSDFPLGVEVTVNGYLSKSGNPIAIADTVKLQDGRSLFAGSEGTGAPPTPAAR
jgi:hypothetical protein